MQAIYKLQPQEINEDFIRALRSTFEHNTHVKITITVETDEDETDETNYLLGTKANKERLLANINSDKRITFTEEAFDTFVRENLGP